MSAAEVIAAEFAAQGAQYPHSGASLVLDALKAAGYAVVELSKPSYIDDPDGDLEPGGVGFNGGPADKDLIEHGVYAFRGQVFDQGDGWTPAQARTIASWWLAAANAAEVSDV